MNDEEEFVITVYEIASRMWQNPRVRWYADVWWGMDYQAFLADRMEVARAARDAGGPWVEAMDF